MSNVKQKRHPRRPDQEWLDLIQECRSSGMTDKAWCEMNHIQPSKFYYHTFEDCVKKHVIFLRIPNQPLWSITRL